jgi:hypothetical protein
MLSTFFWDITPCSPLKVNLRFGRTYRFHLQGQRISQGRNQRERRWLCLTVYCSTYSSNLKMEAKFSSETSVDFQRTTRHYTPEHITLHNHRCENLKSYIMLNVFASKSLRRSSWHSDIQPFLFAYPQIQFFFNFVSPNLVYNSSFTYSIIYIQNKLRPK